MVREDYRFRPILRSLRPGRGTLRHENLLSLRVFSPLFLTNIRCTFSGNESRISRAWAPSFSPCPPHSSITTVRQGFELAGEEDPGEIEAGLLLSRDKWYGFPASILPARAGGPEQSGSRAGSTLMVRPGMMNFDRSETEESAQPHASFNH